MATSFHPHPLQATIFLILNYVYVRAYVLDDDDDAAAVAGALIQVIRPGQERPYIHNQCGLMVIYFDDLELEEAT